MKIFFSMSVVNSRDKTFLAQPIGRAFTKTFSELCFQLNFLHDALLYKKNYTKRDETESPLAIREIASPNNPAIEICSILEHFVPSVESGMVFVIHNFSIWDSWIR